MHRNVFPALCKEGSGEILKEAQKGINTVRTGETGAVDSLLKTFFATVHHSSRSYGAKQAMEV